MERCIELKIPKQITINNRNFNLVKTYKNFAKHKNNQGWYECFNFQDLGLIKEEIKPDRKIQKRRIL